MLFLDAPTVEAFLTRGLLPENIPPSHSSEDLWSTYSSKTDYLDDKKTGHLSRYNASKRGEQRRVFSVPHPNFIYDQALFFQKNWNNIHHVFEGSDGSLSRPEALSAVVRAVKITPHSKLPELKFKKLARFRYCLVADVSRFFPSVYTHAIPWALHGRAAAKRDRSPSSAQNYGNRLDYALRQAQDGQTVGIPVGPDTSRVTSEIVLSAVDKAIKQESPEFSESFLRHVDDYWVGGDSIEQCQEHLRHLRRNLHEFELDINELKTKIVPTRQVFSDSWPIDLERRALEEIKRAATPLSVKYGVITYIGKIVDYVNLTGDDAFIKHIIWQIDRLKVWDEGWSFLEDFLIHCAVQYPHAFDRVARVLSWRKRRGEEINAALWADVIARVTKRNAELGHDSEVLWAMWLSKELGIKIHSSMAELIIKRSSGLAIGYLAHMQAKDYIDGHNISDLIVDQCGLDVQTRYWPALLECAHLELGTVRGNRLVGPNGQKEIFSQKRSLVMWERSPAVFQNHENSEGEVEFAIEGDDDEYDGDIIISEGDEGF